MRSRQIAIRTKTSNWTFGLFLGAVTWLLLSPLFGTLNPWLLIGCIILSIITDGITGKLFSKGMYIE